MSNTTDQERFNGMINDLKNVGVSEDILLFLKENISNDFVENSSMNNSLKEYSYFCEMKKEVIDESVIVLIEYLKDKNVLIFNMEEHSRRPYFDKITKLFEKSLKNQNIEYNNKGIVKQEFGNTKKFVAYNNEYTITIKL